MIIIHKEYCGKNQAAASSSSSLPLLSFLSFSCSNTKQMCERVCVCVDANMKNGLIVCYNNNNSDSDRATNNERRIISVPERTRRTLLFLLITIPN